MMVRRRIVPRTQSIDGATLTIGCSTRCAPATRPPPVHGWRSARWHCNGTCTRMARACDVTSQRGYVLFTTWTACSITPTGCITSWLLPLWEAWDC